MTEKVKLINVVVMLHCMCDCACMNICKGQIEYEYCRTSLSCCSGFKWDQDQATCIPCDIGYIGINCDVRCPFPYFGLDCQSTCNCSEENCDYFKGCRHSTSEQPNSTSRSIGFNFPAISTTLYQISNHEQGFNVTVVKGDANDLQMDLKTTETAPYKAKSLIYPIVGLSVVAVIITAVYIYTWFAEKRILPTNSV